MLTSAVLSVMTGNAENFVLCIYEKNCLSQLAHYLYPATLEEHPMNNHDPDRVLSWKSCNGDLEMTRNVHNQKL